MRTKSELRIIATTTAILVALFSGVAAPAQAAKPSGTGSGSNSSSAVAATSKAGAAFLASKFTESKYILGFDGKTPDFGFTLEAMIQRKAGGDSTAALAPSVKYNLQNAAITGNLSNRTGYLFNTDKSIKAGLAGKWLFTSSALKAKNSPLRASVLKALRQPAAVSKKGVVAGASGSIDYGWVTLGFATNTSLATARLVANQILSQQHADGGFGPDSNGDPAISGTDSTGLVLQALVTVKTAGNTSQNKAIKAAIAKAVAYLQGSATGTNKDHWEAWGGYDVNGTAYAIMGLAAAGVNVSSYSTWLRGQLSTDGGIKTPWSGDSGDIFATAQGVVALGGFSYLTLTK